MLGSVGKMCTNGKGSEHVRQGIGEFLVALVQLQVHLAQVRRAIHANLDERGAASAGSVRFAGAGLLDGHDILPE